MDRPTGARINWQDGMLLRSGHFEMIETRADEMVRLAQKYFSVPGICPGGEPVLRCELSGSRLTVTVESCTALTPDGRLIVIDSSRAAAGLPLSASVDLPAEAPSVVTAALEAMPATDEVGTADPDEDPPRIPYRMERIRLVLGDDAALGRSSTIQIAEVVVSGRDAKPSEDYIPPCASIGASRAFVAGVEKIAARLKSMGGMAVSGCRARKEAMEAREAVPSDTFFAVLFELAGSIGRARESLPAPPYGDPPAAAFRPVRSLLRSVSDLFQMFPGARNAVIKDLVLGEMLPSGDQKFFDSLKQFLDSPPVLDDLRGSLAAHMRFLDDADGIVRYLSTGDFKPVERDMGDYYEYRGVRYWPVPYEYRRLRTDENRHYLEVGGLKTESAVKSILVLMRCSQGTPESRENVVVRMGVNNRKTWIFADSVQVDARTEKNRIVLLYPEAAESNVRELTLISGALDFAPLENAPATDLLVYGAS